MRAAEVVPGVTRRAMLAASPLFCLPVPAMAQATDGMAVDIHSRSGNLILLSFGRGQSAPVAEPMRQGGMSAICLAVVSDSPIIKRADGRLRPSRDPKPGELYDFTQRAFAALHTLAREQGTPILKTAGSNASMRPINDGRCVTSSSRITGQTSRVISRPSPASTAA